MKANKLVPFFIAAVVLMPTLAASAISTTVEKKAASPASPSSRQFATEGSLANGAPVSIIVVAPSSQEGGAVSAMSAALSRARSLESELFSEGGVDSQIVNLKTGESLALPPDSFDMIAKAVDLSAYTNGWYDVSAPSDKSLFSPRDWRRITLNKDARTIAFKSSGMRLDLKRIAAGYMVDLIMDELIKSGFSNAKVTVGSVERIAGRDIFTPWKVEIGFGAGSEYAHRANNYNLSNVASATVTASGMGNGLIDARSRKPVAQGMSRSVTVFASDAATATAYALAAYTLGPKVGLRFIEAHPETQGIIVDNTGALFASKGLGATEVKSEPFGVEVQTTADGGPDDLKQKEREENTDR